MRSINYSENVDLLDYEVEDWDTKHKNPTGINDDRMRLPTRYDIAKYYKRFKRKNQYGKYERGKWVKKAEKELLDFSNDFDWQITYDFPTYLRLTTTPNDHHYGGSYVTMRRLYLILCERLNGGRFFIDDYFDQVYPQTIKDEVDEKLDELKTEIISGYIETATDFGVRITKKGMVYKADQRKRGLRKVLKDYSEKAEAWETRVGKEVADLIKEHIRGCLESGQLPLEIENDTARTEAIRKRYGLPEEPRFYATGQLIKSLQLYVTIRGKGEWRKPTYILG